MGNGNNDLTVMEKDNIVMKEKGMVKHNKDVCEIKEDKNLQEKRKRKGDSACVTEQGKNDLTMMEKDGLIMMEKEMDQVTV